MSRIPLLALLATSICLGPAHSRAADPAAIADAIARGKAFLLKEPKESTYGRLACYALVKAGADPQHPDIQKAVQQVLEQCKSSQYVPTRHHNYEAGVDAMLLEAVDREQYRTQLAMIAEYLIARQKPHGGWFYPPEIMNRAEYGDTSITQYALLGLWAADRAGVEIPVETWERAAKWLIQTQYGDGSFGYHPIGPTTPPADGPTHTMSMAGTGSLLLIRHVLFRDTPLDVEPKTADAAPTGRRFGVLERLPDENPGAAAAGKSKSKTARTLTPSAFEKPIKDGLQWTSDHFVEPVALTKYPNYYLYGIERAGALVGADKLGKHAWYDEGADELLRRQLAGGNWDEHSGPVAATSWSLLFLSKATAASVVRPKRTPVVGGGLLVGGRGLPDDLDALKVQDGAVATRRKLGPVDDLLSNLEKSSEAKVSEVQEAVVEAVQLDRPEDLIGQVDRLRKLAIDPRVEVRRTAVWALGRTGTVAVAPVLIRALSDSDESVAREASLALTVLSRRPNGIGTAIDPADNVPESATDAERAARRKTWNEASTRAWNDWYLKVRPYAERDDKTTLKRKP